MTEMIPFTPMEELEVALRLLNRATWATKSLRLKPNDLEAIYSYCTGAADCISTARNELQNGIHPYLREEIAE